MAYSDEQLNTLHENLPKELLDALYSEQTSEAIGNVCEQYGVEDMRVSVIAKYAGQVLMGLILPSEFEDAIRKNVELPEVLVKAIASEISRFVFYPVKASLEQIHKQVGEKEEIARVDIPTPRHSDRAGTPQGTEEQDDYIVQQEKEVQEEKPVFSEEQGGEDPYREKAE